MSKEHKAFDCYLSFPQNMTPCAAYQYREGRGGWHLIIGLGRQRFTNPRAVNSSPLPCPEYMGQHPRVTIIKSATSSTRPEKQGATKGERSRIRPLFLWLPNRHRRIVFSDSHSRDTPNMDVPLRTEERNELTLSCYVLCVGCYVMR